MQEETTPLFFHIQKACLHFFLQLKNSSTPEKQKS